MKNFKQTTNFSQVESGYKGKFEIEYENGLLLFLVEIPVRKGRNYLTLAISSLFTIMQKNRKKLFLFQMLVKG